MYCAYVTRIHKSFLTLSTTSKLGRYGAVRLKPIPENDPGLYQKGAI